MTGKDRLLALGLMSGTSCDGVDAALVETDGRAAIQLRAVLSEPMTRRSRPLGRCSVDAATSPRSSAS